MRACPNESMVARYVDGDVDAAVRATLEAHAAGCDPCRELLSELAHGATLEASEPCEVDGRLLLPAGARVDRYVVEAPLGAGAMGVVYAAADPDLGRRVALKIVDRNSASLRDRPGKAGAFDRVADGSARQLREAQALARVDHPHVVSVYDVGVHAEHVFVAMELVDGEDLASWLRTPRNPREILGVLVGAGRGLAAAHAAGLVHRDFKPANILIGVDGRARVTDFGLAKAAEDATADDAAPASPLAQDMTMRGTLLGTPAYMAPEQFAGLRAGPAADQFAFAVTAWEALFGKRPFAGATLAALRDAVTRGVIESPANSRIERALRRALDPDPERRWPSLAALLDELVRDPARSVRRALVACGAAAVLVGGGFALAHLRSETPGPSCELAPTWTAPQRVALTATAARLGRAQLVTDIASSLDAYAGALASATTRACGRPSDDPVAVCLARRRVELARLVDVLVGADRAAILDRADHAIDGLADPAACTTASAELLPRDPAVRLALDVARGQVAYAGALSSTGQKPAAARVFASLVPRLRTLANDRLLADALDRYATAIKLLEPDTAEQLYTEAIRHASAAHADELLANVWLDLALFAGAERKLEREALAYAQAARAAVAGAGDKPVLLARYLGVHASILTAFDHNDEAAAQYEAALALVRTKQLGDKLGDELEFNYAVNLEGRGKLADAAAIFERLLAADLAKHPHHPHTADTSFMLGNVSLERGLFAIATTHLERALAIYTAAYGPDCHRAAEVLTSLSAVASTQGHLAEAVQLGDRAAAIFERGGYRTQIATLLVNVASARLYLHDREHARADLERASELARKMDDRRTMQNAQAGLGDLDYDVSELRGALSHYQAALELDADRVTEDDVIRAGYLTSVGHTLGLLGRHDEALRLLERAYRVVAHVEGHDTLRWLALLALAEELHALHREPARVRALAGEVAAATDLDPADRRRLARLH